MRDDDAAANVARSLRRSLIGDNVVADGQYFAKLVEEILAPLPVLPSPTPHESYLLVRLENMQTFARKLLAMVANG